MEILSKSADKLTDEELFTPVPLLARILGQGVEYTTSLSLQQRKVTQNKTFAAL